MIIFLVMNLYRYCQRYSRNDWIDTNLFVNCFIKYIVTLMVDPGSSAFLEKVFKCQVPAFNTHYSFSRQYHNCLFKRAYHHLS